MSRRFARLFAIATLTLAAALAASGAARAQAQSLGTEIASKSGVQADMLFWIRDAESKLMQLAEAMPEAKYSWSPDKGVRTVGEVFMHVAAANYGVPAFMGVQPPEGFKFDTFEHSLTKKADIMKALQASFAHMEGALKAASDADLEKPVDLFGMKLTQRGAYMLLLSHVHEHLGQSIAYARSNKVTPPWTAKEQAAETKDKK